MANVIASIVLKFGSTVCLRLALEEYQNLSSNTSYFIYSMMMTVAPTSLLAPIYTYDHVNCMSKNFIMPQSGAELISCYSLFLSVFPILFFVILPSTWKRFFCCGRGYLKVHNEMKQQRADGTYKKDFDFMGKVSLVLKWIITLYVFLLTLFYLGVILVVHVFQYRIFAGGFLISGGVNEVWALLELMIIFCLYRSTDITYDEIKEKMDLFNLMMEKEEQKRRDAISKNDKHRMSNEQP